MTDVEGHIKSIKDELPDNVVLVAVSKFHPIEALKAAYDAGQRIFGESRVQELLTKYPQMPKDVEWHFIGHLQTNKVKSLIPMVSLIHSVDTEKLLEVINTEAAKIGKVIDVLLQLHVAKETTKFGFTCDDCIELASSGKLLSFQNIRVRGVMGMATNIDDAQIIRTEFKEIHNIFNTLKEKVFNGKSSFDIVSMGMSDDYHIAIEEGSTMVRIGSVIFGLREY